VHAGLWADCRLADANVKQAPFLVTLLVKGVTYGSPIAFVNIVEPGTRLLRVPLGSGSVQLVSVVFSFGATWAVLFMLLVSQSSGITRQ